MCVTSHQQLINIRSYGEGAMAKVLSDSLEKPGIEPETPG